MPILRFIPLHLLYLSVRLSPPLYSGEVACHVSAFLPYPPYLPHPLYLSCSPCSLIRKPPPAADPHLLHRPSE